MLNDPACDGQGKSADQDGADSARMLGYLLIGAALTWAVLAGLLAGDRIPDSEDPRPRVELAGIGR